VDGLALDFFSFDDDDAFLSGAVVIRLVVDDAGTAEVGCFCFRLTAAAASAATADGAGAVKSECLPPAGVGGSGTEAAFATAAAAAISACSVASDERRFLARNNAASDVEGRRTGSGG
jgi:hypothetical protein